MGSMSLKKKKSICFVSETGQTEHPLNDPSVRYRCFHPAEVLSRKGHFCSVYSAAKFYENPCLDFDTYVFHRPNVARKNFQRVVDNLHKMGRTLIADYDDLIFGGEDIALQSSAVKNATLTEEKAIAAFASNLSALKKFSRVTTSTRPLAAYVSKFNADAQVAVVENILPPSFVYMHDLLKTASILRPENTIGYFSGTKSHVRDFPVVEEVLYRVLLENPDFSLLVVGPLEISGALASLPNVSAGPVVNFLRLPSVMTKCATVIAPLEDGDFNACKSRVKFLEAAVSGCRLIATPIPDMVAVGDGRMAYATTQDEWYDALSFPPPGGRDMSVVKKNMKFLRDNLQVEGLELLGGLQ